jgi:SDR family mycofactocin-dependent oxidoreductase
MQSFMRFDGKTALVTGAARGQGRAHALGLAREGADVAVCDICEDIASIPYALGRASDLEQTARLIECEGRRAISGRVDVRSWEQIRGFADLVLNEFGKVDVLVPNAGIFGSAALLHELEEQAFDDMIDVNLKGVWLAIKAVLPAMIERKYGRIVIPSSTAGLVGAAHFSHYCASKHALDGLVKAVALEQGVNGITVNLVAPTSVATNMILNESLYRIFNSAQPTQEAMADIMTSQHAIPRPWLEPEDVTRVVLFLASDDARYTTASIYKVDMGWTAR